MDRLREKGRKKERKKEKRKRERKKKGRKERKKERRKERKKERRKERKKERNFLITNFIQTRLDIAVKFPVPVTAYHVLWVKSEQAYKCQMF